MLKILMFVILLLSGFASLVPQPWQVRVNIVCQPGNDLYRVLTDNDVKCRRFTDPYEALRSLPGGSGLMILADGYPSKRTAADAELFSEASRKNIRIYIEYPGMIPGMQAGENAFIKLGYYGAVKERTVVSSGFFCTGCARAYNT